MRSKQETFFREFQLPIDPSVPPEQSFQRLVDERRLASSSDGSSPEQRPRSLPPTSPRRRTTSNSLKLHILDRPSSSKPKSAPDLNFLQEGMESDLTEQEDYDDDDDNDDDLKDLQTKQDEHEDDDDEHERAPEREYLIILDMPIHLLTPLLHTPSHSTPMAQKSQEQKTENLD